MNNKKCSSCGFINFITAEVCKKCEAPLAAPVEALTAPVQVPRAAPSEAPPAAEYADPQAPPVDANYSIYNDLYARPAYQAPYPTKSSFPVGKVILGIIVVIAIMTTLNYKYNLLGRWRIHWIEYHPESLNITVMMPNHVTRIEPVETPFPSGKMTNHSFTSVVPGQGSVVFCFVEFRSSGGGLLSEETMTRALDAELNDWVQRTNSHLISKKEIMYGGMKGLDFVTEPPDDTSPRVTRAYGRMLLNSSRLYFLAIAAVEGTELYSSRDKFLDMSMKNEDYFRVKEDMERDQAK